LNVIALTGGAAMALGRTASANGRQYRDPACGFDGTLHANVEQIVCMRHRA
jgi:hypothetical protein